MNKITVLMWVLVAWSASLSAQITREQADAVVLEHLKNELTLPYQLYIHVHAPDEAGIAVTTFREEVLRATYACWAYYLDENPGLNKPCRHRYLFVKADDGNLLEVITGNDLGPDDLTLWIPVDPAGLSGEGHSGIRPLYPNPTTGELRIENGEWRIENVEVLDIHGKKQFSAFNFQRSTQIDISHLPAGVYFVRIKTATGTATQKVIKH